MARKLCFGEKIKDALNNILLVPHKDHTFKVFNHMGALGRGQVHQWRSPPATSVEEELEIIEMCLYREGVGRSIMT